MAAAWVQASGPRSFSAELGIRYSQYERNQLTVPAGVPLTILLHNDDPIDHEWIVGDSAVHERHRNGTDPVHGSRPTEVTIPAGTSRLTTITFEAPGTYQYICHLPGHEVYGMVGTIIVTDK